MCDAFTSLAFIFVTIVGFCEGRPLFHAAANALGSAAPVLYLLNLRIPRLCVKNGGTCLAAHEM